MLCDLAPMNYSKVVTDAENGVSLKEWTLDPREIGDASGNWSVRKKTLSVGRQDGTEVIDVDNGLLRFCVVPSRGFNVWEAHVGNIRRVGIHRFARLCIRSSSISGIGEDSVGSVDSVSSFLAALGIDGCAVPGW